MQEASPVCSSLRGLNYGSAAHPGITIGSPKGSSRLPSLQRSPSKHNVESPMLLGTCCNGLRVPGPGVSVSILAVTHRLSLLALGVQQVASRGLDHSKDLPGTVQGHPDRSRIYLEQFKSWNLLNHPDFTLPMEKQDAPPTNGRLGGTPHPI